MPNAFDNNIKLIYNSCHEKHIVPLKSTVSVISDISSERFVLNIKEAQSVLRSCL